MTPQSPTQCPHRRRGAGRRGDGVWMQVCRGAFLKPPQLGGSFEKNRFGWLRFWTNVRPAGDVKNRQDRLHLCLHFPKKTSLHDEKAEFKLPKHPDATRCQHSSLVTQSVNPPTPEHLPSHVLKHLKTPFTSLFTPPHCFVTLPKGTPLAWPCTEPPHSHFYLTHTYTQKEAATPS